MREILFKAKRTDNGKWVEGYYIYHIKRTPCVFGDSVKPEDEQHVIMQDGFSDWNMPRDTVHYDIDPSTLCQYTGLTDKNGRKIWENDILREYADTDSLGNDLYYFYQVFWDNINSEYGVKNDVESMGLSCVSTNWAEVIGNVFDNPELLEKAR